MNILGIDTSQTAASVCLFDTANPNNFSEFTINTSKKQSQIIMPMLEELLKISGKSLDTVEKIAVCNGPGSYTGIRIGVAAAKAIAFAKGIEITTVSSLESVAFSTHVKNRAVLALIHARKDLYYAGVYKFLDDTSFEKILDDKIITLDEILPIVKKFDVLAAGDVPENIGLKSESFEIRALNIAKVGSASKSLDPEDINASYLQKTEAERNLESKGVK